MPTSPPSTSLTAKDTAHPAYVLLRRAHSPTTSTALFHDRVRHKPLVLRATSPDPQSQDARATRRSRRLHCASKTASKQRPKRLSAREKKQLGVGEIPKNERKWELFVPLHRLWSGYMREVLGLDVKGTHVTGKAMGKGKGGSKEQEQGQDSELGEVVPKVLTPAAAGPMLVSADYHGAILEVVRSRCVDRVGIRGIVVKDSKFTFEMVTRSNVLKGMCIYIHVRSATALPLMVDYGWRKASRPTTNYVL